MIECIKFKSYDQGHLLGFADLYISGWGIEIRGCGVYSKEGRRWINVPSREFTTEEGKKAFAPIIRFTDENRYREFCTQAKAAVDKWIEENDPNSLKNIEEPKAEEIPF